MSALPAELSTGMVHGRFIVALVDGDDADQEPEVIPATGRVSFKASVGYVPVPVTAEGPVTVMKGPITGVLDNEGYLSTPHPTTGEPMYRGVKLLATDDQDMAVKDWTWTADYRFDSVNATTMQIPAHSFALPGGAVVDLTTMVKVPSSPGYGLPQAEAAALRAETASAESITGAQVVDDDLVLLRRNGEQINAGRVKGPPGADSVVPGPRGEQGPAGISNANQFYKVSETAGRTVSVWDYLKNRDQLIYGDTGIRDITALAPNVTAGKLYLYRDGQTVTMIFDAVQMAGANGGSYDMIPAGGIPTGFRPTRTFWFNGIDGPPGLRRVGVAASGWVPVYLSPAPGDVYRGTISWRTIQPWPTTLPGVAA